MKQEEKLFACLDGEDCKISKNCAIRFSHKHNKDGCIYKSPSASCPPCIPVAPEPKPEMKSCGKQTTIELCSNCSDWSVCKFISRAKKPEEKQVGYICPECSGRMEFFKDSTTQVYCVDCEIGFRLENVMEYWKKNKYSENEKEKPTKPEGEQGVKESMDIYSPKGTNVEFAFPNAGYPHDQEKAKKYLKLGGIYKVEKTVVGGYHTDVYLLGKPEVAFNSVMFTEPKQPEQEGKSKVEGVEEICKELDKIQNEIRGKVDSVVWWRVSNIICHIGAELSHRHFVESKLRQSIERETKNKIELEMLKDWIKYDDKLMGMILDFEYNVRKDNEIASANKLHLDIQTHYKNKILDKLKGEIK